MLENPVRRRNTVLFAVKTIQNDEWYPKLSPIIAHCDFLIILAFAPDLCVIRVLLDYIGKHY